MDITDKFKQTLREREREREMRERERERDRDRQRQRRRQIDRQTEKVFIRDSKGFIYRCTKL